MTPFDDHQIEMKALAVSPKQDDNSSSLALLLAYNVENVSVTGPGTIVGNGTALA